jgi:hypothetical protein
MKHEQKTPASSSAPRLGKKELMDIAASTLKAIEAGTYEAHGTNFNLMEAVKYTNEHTKFFSADSNLAAWLTGGEGEETAQPSEDHEHTNSVQRTIVECSVLVGARTLKEELQVLEGVSESNQRVGVLNFASAKNPGGGFMTGAQAQVCLPFLTLMTGLNLTIVSLPGRINRAFLHHLYQPYDRNSTKILSVAQTRS